MEFFFPSAYEEIDWSKKYEFLETELQQVRPQAEIGKRVADKLAKVWLKNGDELWVMVHIEVQNQRQTAFPERMFTYNYRIRDLFNCQVASFAILTAVCPGSATRTTRGTQDQDAGWRPTEFSQQLLGCEIAFNFQIAKLLDYKDRWQELEESRNPFATVVMAHLKAQETRGEQQERKRWKLSLIRRLYQKGYEREQIVNLFKFIDWVMQLPQELEKEFWQEVNQLQEEKQMQYITSVERIGIEKGLEQGLDRGLHQGALRQLLRLLQHRFDSVPESVQSRLTSCTVEQLEELFDVALTVGQLDRFVDRIPVEDTSVAEETEHP